MGKAFTRDRYGKHRTVECGERLRVKTKARTDGLLDAIDDERARPDRRRDARRRREQHDRALAQQAQHFGLVPAAKRLCAEVPGRRQQRVREEAIARQRIEVVGTAAQSRELRCPRFRTRSRAPRRPARARLPESRRDRIRRTPSRVGRRFDAFARQVARKIAASDADAYVATFASRSRDRQVAPPSVIAIKAGGDIRDRPRRAVRSSRSIPAEAAGLRRDTEPRVGRKPYTPQSEAGKRTEPSASLPSAIGTRPPATAAADPPDDPPGVRERSCGLRVGPKWRFSVVPPMPNSSMLVTPTQIAPARSSRRRQRHRAPRADRRCAASNPRSS